MKQNASVKQGNERSSVDLYCKNKKKKDSIQKQVKLWEFLWIPGSCAIFFTALPFIVSEFFARFGIIFLVSFASFTTLFFVKKGLGIPNGDFGQKLLEIVIKSSLNAIGIAVYVSLFFFGEIQPLFVYDPVENTLIVGLTTMTINIGMWGLIWILAFVTSIIVIKNINPVKKVVPKPVN